MENFSDGNLAALFDQNVCVKYLVQKVERFIQSHEHGMIVLTGLSGVGKTWFCRSLESSISNLATVYIPLKYNARLSMTAMLKYIENFCKTKQWTFPKDDLDLTKHRTLIPEIVKQIKANCPATPLFFILDGLDELPEDCELWHYLPYNIQDLSPGCFVLLAHRPGLESKPDLLLHEMLAHPEHALQLDMLSEDMQATLIEYIQKQHLEGFTKEILEKSHSIFLYVHYYCYLLSLKALDAQNLPDQKEIYPEIFQQIQQRAGKELYHTSYIPLLATLSVVQEPVSLKQLACWDIQEPKVEMAVKDIAHLLERDRDLTASTTLAIRHQSMLEFFQEQEDWRKQYQEKEKAILAWIKKELEKMNPNDLEPYALKHALAHWNRLADKDLQAAEQILPLDDLKKHLLRWIEQLGAQFPSKAKIYESLGTSYHIKCEYKKAQEYLGLALDIQLSKLGADHPHIASIYVSMAYAYHRQGQYEKALQFYQKALTIQLSRLGEDHPGLVTTYNNMAYTYHRQGQYDKALQFFEKVLAIRLPKLGEDHLGLVTTYNNMAGVYQDQGQYEKALQFFGKALAIQLAKLGEHHLALVTTYNNMAGVYHHQEQYQKALQFFQKALAIQVAKLGHAHPDLATTYGNIASVYYYQEEYEKALRFYDKAVEIQLAKLGETHLDLATTYNNIAGVYQHQEEYEKALQFYDKALSIQLVKLGEKHPDLATTYGNMASVYYYQKRYEKALQFYEKALSIQLAKLEEAHPDLATTYSNMASVYYYQKHYEKALRFYEKALSIQLSQIGGAHHPDVASTYGSIATVYRAQDQHEKALEFYAKALGVDFPS